MHTVMGVQRIRNCANIILLSHIPDTKAWRQPHTKSSPESPSSTRVIFSPKQVHVEADIITATWGVSETC